MPERLTIRRAVPLALLLAMAMSLGPARLCAQQPAPADETPVFGTTVVIPGGLKGDIYLLPTNTMALPNFARLKPVGTVYTSSLDIPPRAFELGFPGVTNRYEWFAIDYTGRFWIGRAGEYKFELSSDDGSKLYIDGTLVIDNDGIHAVESKWAKVVLGCGVHSIRVSYFQGPRITVALMLRVQAPDDKMRVFNTDRFTPPANPDNWVCGSGIEVASGNKSSKDSAGGTFLEGEASEVLNSQPPPDAFPFDVAAYRFAGSGGNVQSSIAFQVMAGNLASVAGRGKTRRMRMALVSLVKDSSGQIVDRYSVDAPFSVKEADMDAAKTSPITYTHPVSLAPGIYTVETVMFDRESNRASVRTMKLEAPAAEPGVGLSNIVLVERVEPVPPGAAPGDPFIFRGGRVLPSIRTELPPGSKPSLYFVVYPDPAAADKPRLTIDVFLDGRPAGRAAPELPAPDESGAIPVTMSGVSRPGDLELRFTVSQGGKSVSRSLKYTVRPQ